MKKNSAEFEISPLMSFLIIIAVFTMVFAIASLLAGFDDSESGSSAPSSGSSSHFGPVEGRDYNPFTGRPWDMPKEDWKYATERFKQEGATDMEAVRLGQEAWKFHQRIQRERKYADRNYFE